MGRTRGEKEEKEIEQSETSFHQGIIRKNITKKSYLSSVTRLGEIDKLLSENQAWRLVEIEVECDRIEHFEQFYEHSVAISVLRRRLWEDQLTNYLSAKAREEHLHTLLTDLRKSNRRGPVMQRKDDSSNFQFDKSVDYRDSDDFVKEGMNYSINDPFATGKKQSEHNFRIDQGYNDHGESYSRKDKRILLRGESSSVLIDSKEFEVFDKAQEPGFNFEEYFKKMDKPGLGELSWEPKTHDIYYPEYTSQALNTPAAKTESTFKESKNFGVKYSFQVDDKKRAGSILDYFHSESNMMPTQQGSATKHDVINDSTKQSPMIAKIVNHEQILLTSTKPKNGKDKSKGTNKKIKKDPLAINIPNGNHCIYGPTQKSKKTVAPNNYPITAFSSIDEVAMMKYKPLPGNSVNDNFFKVTSGGKELKTLKKKNSLLHHPQTRSNSRDPIKNTNDTSPEINALRSLTKDRTESSNQNLKKKMRIRDRNENYVPLKDSTNSVFIKKKKGIVSGNGQVNAQKKNLETTESQNHQTIDQKIINKMLFKSIKQKKESSNQNVYGQSSNALAGNFAIASKLNLNLEHSNLTDEVPSRLIDSGPQKSPKYDANFAKKPKNNGDNLYLDFLSKAKPQPVPVKTQPTKRQKKTKSCTKKKQKDSAKTPAVYLPTGASPGDMWLRRSLERSGKLLKGGVIQSGSGKYNPAKSLKRDDLSSEIQQSVNQMILKSGELRYKGTTIGTDQGRTRQMTTEDTPYYSQRSKTTQKVPKSEKEKKLALRKKKDDILKESIRPVSGVLPMTSIQLGILPGGSSNYSNLNSPAKARHLGKNSSSLLER
jgi:hypothetical protein